MIFDGLSCVPCLPLWGHAKSDGKPGRVFTTEGVSQQDVVSCIIKHFGDNSSKPQLLKASWMCANYTRLRDRIPTNPPGALYITTSQGVTPYDLGGCSSPAGK